MKSLLYLGSFILIAAILALTSLKAAASPKRVVIVPVESPRPPPISKAVDVTLNRVNGGNANGNGANR
jgi:hypothetical protein